MDFKPFKIDRYLLLEKLATGGMAEVYRAKARGAGGFEKQLAVKRILPNYSTNEEFRKMFEYEARLSSMLTHANIVQIYDFVKSGETYLLAMEYVNGKNLRQLVNKARKLNYSIPVEFGIYVINEVCKGLEYAHQKKEELSGRPLNIIHRDMSPQNIMLSYDGAVKIVDFGIAKAKDRVDETRSGVIKGKFGYMSPEQANGVSVDHRTDIFSTAIILYEMLTGKRLFAAENDMQTLKLIQECIIPPPTKSNPRISLELERILMKGLLKDTVHRYQSAGQFHRALQEYLNKYFPKYHQPETAEIIQRIFAEEIENEKRRFEQLHRQSIPYSQQGESAPAEEERSLGEALEGDQTRSEFESDTAVTNSQGEEESKQEPVGFVPKELTMSSQHGLAQPSNNVSESENEGKTLAQDISKSMGDDANNATIRGGVDELFSKREERTEDSFDADSMSHVTPTGEQMATLKEPSYHDQKSNSTSPKTPTSEMMSLSERSVTSPSRSQRSNHTGTSSQYGSQTGGLPSEPKFEIENMPKQRKHKGHYVRERDFYATKKKSTMVPYLIAMLGFGLTASLYRFLYDGGVPTIVKTLDPERGSATEKEITPNLPPLKIPAASGECVLKIESDPTGAEVTINGAPKGVTTATVSVPCGKSANVTVKKQGYETNTENVFMKDSEERFFKSLKKIPMGKLELTLSRNAKIYLAGDLVGEAVANQPFSLLLRAGKPHQLKFVNELYHIEMTESFVVKEGYITPKYIRLEGSPASKKR